MPTPLAQKPVDDPFCPDDLNIRQAFDKPWRGQERAVV